MEEIKLRIIEEIANTKNLIEGLTEQVKPIAPDDAYGRLSRMDAIINKSVQESSLRAAEEKLSKLNIALSRIDSPNFGICKGCKKPIPIERLMIIPESIYCMNCAK